MASWTPERSALLSLLLDDVVGTEVMVSIRRDYCKMHDSFISYFSVGPAYYTGSRAEGIDLPESDDDYMFDMNAWFMIKVKQSPDDAHEASFPNLFHLCTDNAPPGFAMLRYDIHFQCPLFFPAASNWINGVPYLSSVLYLRILKSAYEDKPTLSEEAHRIQGPSYELWTEYMEKSE